MKKAVLSTLVVAVTSLAAPATAVTFVDMTEASRLATFEHNTGAFGEKWLPETMGSGVILFDADGDERLDVLFVNGTRFEGKPGERTTQRLFLNRGGLRFEDVTEKAGLDIAAYCLGGAAGDLDNDGDADLYLSCLGTDYLLENVDGTFRDVSERAGLVDRHEFGASVALLDADRDGLLDIFATRYVIWTPEKDIFCTLDGKTKSYCTPESYPGASPRFYRNRGDLRFQEATKEVGVYRPDAKSLGVAIIDLDDDGWLDLAVANDTQPNLLFRNEGDGTFEEIGVASGMAFSETGVARGGMGIDAADFNASGRQSLVIGNFANEMVALYRNEGNRLFIDAAPRSDLGRKSLLTLAFGTFFFDYDLDGWLDVLLANGHLDREIENVQSKVAYEQPTQLFRNTGGGEFEEVTDKLGDALAAPRVARGAAYGDLDDDGDLDVVLSTSGGPPVLLANRGAGHGNWLRIDLRGTKSNRDGIGAVVEVTAGGRTQERLVRTGSSYLSQSAIDPTFGLDDAVKADRIRVIWPSGTVSQREDVAANQVLEIVEPTPAEGARR